MVSRNETQVDNPSLTFPYEPAARIMVIGVGGGGGNAVNNMVAAELHGVEFLVCNTDSQALAQSLCQQQVQLGRSITQGLGAGAKSEIGRLAAEEVIDDLIKVLSGLHMVFITCGMGGGTGTGAAPVIARAARELGILTVGVVTKPFQFEGHTRMRVAEQGIEELQQYVDTLIVIPNQNLFRIANTHTTFTEAFKMADDVLHCGVRGVTDLIINPGLVNLDFADIRTIIAEMGKMMMGTGEAEGEKRAIEAAEAAINNPLLDEVSIKGARAVLIQITGNEDLTLFELDEATQRIRDEVDDDANIIWGSKLDPTFNGKVRVSVVATGMDADTEKRRDPPQRSDSLTEGKHPKHPHTPGGPPPPGRPQSTPPRSEHYTTPTASQLAAALSERKASEAARRAADPGGGNRRNPSYDAVAQQQNPPPALPRQTTAPARMSQQNQVRGTTPKSLQQAVPRQMPQKTSEQASSLQRTAQMPKGRNEEEADEGKSREWAHSFRKAIGGRFLSPANPIPTVAAGGNAEIPRTVAPASRVAAGAPKPQEAPNVSVSNPVLDEEPLEIPAFLRRQAN